MSLFSRKTSVPTLDIPGNNKFVEVITNYIVSDYCIENLPSSASELSLNETGTQFGPILKAINDKHKLIHAARLESDSEDKFICIIVDSANEKHFGLLGFDVIDGKALIGLSIHLFPKSTVTFSGDGILNYHQDAMTYMLKPMSMFAMWRLSSILLESINNCQSYNPKDDWMQVYDNYDRTYPENLRYWLRQNVSDDMNEGSIQFYHLSMSPEYLPLIQCIQNFMTEENFECLSTSDIRSHVEKNFDKRYDKMLISKCVMQIYGQLSLASNIIDNLYLGSSYNASDFVRLKENNVSHILNMTKEIDNFFISQDFQYKKVPVEDVETTNLLEHWASTHQFINEARKNNTACLVHCKMGVSRSASTVIAYLIKEKQMRLKEALDHVKKRRSIIKPNPGFMKQLETYEGIVIANSNKAANFLRVNSSGQDFPEAQLRKLDISRLETTRKVKSALMMKENQLSWNCNIPDDEK